MTLISVCTIVFCVLQCMGLALCASIHDTGCMIEYEWQYEHNYCIKFDQRDDRYCIRSYIISMVEAFPDCFLCGV